MRHSTDGISNSYRLYEKDYKNCAIRYSKMNSACLSEVKYTWISKLNVRGLYNNDFHCTELLVVTQYE